MLIIQLNLKQHMKTVHFSIYRNIQFKFYTCNLNIFKKCFFFTPIAKPTTNLDIFFLLNFNTIKKIKYE